ncbi:MAG TPA: glycosyl hydrolase [Opitutaceae bacterium]|nr:glycosyl hydrolase [Opitutaceae bacterium]
MKTRFNPQYPLVATLALSAVASLHAAQAWREITMPTVAEVAAAFPQPPTDYSAIHWAIWGGPQTKERIIADIEHVHANGGGVYMIDNSQRVQPKYLSPEYMDLVKTVVQECKKRGMKVWIEGDCGYPDGFAGGIISRDYPQLGMQGILADAHCTVPAGQTLDLPLPVDTLGILAYQRPEPGAPAAGAVAPAVKEFPLPADGTFKYTAPRGGAGELTVQLPNADVRYNVTVGEPFSIPVPPGTKRIFLTTAGAGGARGRGGRGAGGAPEGTVVPLPAAGHLKWTAPADGGSWEIAFIRHVYRTSPTRNDNGDDGGATKDTLFTLIDYLDPVATDTYLKVIYGAYEQAVGEEFGKTILGFRADETDYSGVTPWTPKLLGTFQAMKGYDLKPYIPLIFGGHMTPEAQRAKADYADVWSRMFRDNFYKHMGDWCTARNMEFMIHLNHEESMLSLVNSEGSFWRDMRYTGVPGVDNLSQIGPGIIADFPKLAASAAHINGHPLAWEESGGSPNQTGKFVADYHLVRGVNYLNIRGLNVAPPAAGTTLLDLPSTMGHYVSRAQYLLAVGRPAAQVALLHPTDSMWYGDRDADTDTVSIVTQLLEHQIDFDHIDAESLTTDCTLAGGGLKNLSGQVYHAVIVPTSTVIQKAVLARLQDFARGGGKVVFVGRAPTMVMDRTFLQVADSAPDLSFATLEPTPKITARVVAALPAPDVKLDAAAPPIKYNHRSYKDGEVYFFFNESKETLTRTATIAGQGQVQVWDATTGIIHPLTGVAGATGRVAVPLNLGPQEARFIVIGAIPASAGGPVPTVSTSQSVANLDGDWSVTLGDRQVTGALKPWNEMGVTAFAGMAVYKREFTLGPVLQGKHVYLDLGDVHEIARVRLNGREFAPSPWPPYLWDVTAAITSGANTLEVQVQAAPLAAARGRGMGMPGGPAGGPPGGVGGPPPPAPAPAAGAGSGLLGPVRVVAQ